VTFNEKYAYAFRAHYWWAAKNEIFCAGLTEEQAGEALWLAADVLAHLTSEGS
jgi:hypothetical protein